MLRSILSSYTHRWHVSPLRLLRGHSRDTCLVYFRDASQMMYGITLSTVGLYNIDVGFFVIASLRSYADRDRFNVNLCRRERAKVPR
jgi:hypothetical protein